MWQWAGEWNGREEAREGNWVYMLSAAAGRDGQRATSGAVRDNPAVAWVPWLGAMERTFLNSGRSERAGHPQRTQKRTMSHPIYRFGPCPRPDTA